MVTVAGDTVRSRGAWTYVIKQFADGWKVVHSAGTHLPVSDGEPRDRAMRHRKTFREKLADDKDLPRVEKISPAMAKKWGPGTIVIPAPSEVNEIMRRVPRGKVITINRIREIVTRGKRLFVRDHDQAVVRPRSA
jgi:hypothetical protein